MTSNEALRNKVMKSDWRGRLLAMLENSSILVTGGTGSFGHAFVRMTLERFNPKRLIILSRDEMKQWEMAKLYEGDSRVRFFIGDVRDRDRLHRAMQGVDYVIHAAATKIVPTAEYNPLEAIKTNINGAVNVIEASLDANVKRVVALSTDKASSPINLYGATKLASDKLFTAANSYSGAEGTKFAVVRYGNVMGSRGSVIPFFTSLPKGTPTPITDEKMTRFMISLEEGVSLVWSALQEMTNGEIFVKKIPSMRVVDIAKVVRPHENLEIVGIRPGEKLHEQMIGTEDARFTVEFPDHYRILPSTLTEVEVSKYATEGGKLAPANFCYTSEENSEWMSPDDLESWLAANKHRFLEI